MLRIVFSILILSVSIFKMEAQTNPETIEVFYPSEKPYGYGSIKGWYGNKKSNYILDNPIKTQHEQMNRNYVQDGEQWVFLHIPQGSELPVLGDWWDWDVEINNIKNLIEDLGDKLGKFETHFISGTEVVDPLTWEVANNPQRFEITNSSLKTSLSNKYQNNLPLVFTQDEWNAFGIEDIYSFSYVDIDGIYFKPVSPGNNRINKGVLDVINRDIKGEQEVNHLKAEECGGICFNYLTKNNRKRNYLVFNLGFWNGVSDHIFNIPSDEEKKLVARKEIYSSIAHEYNHVVQNQLYDPVIPIRWNGEENGYGERSPNAISRWWIESFASILPEILGYQFPYTLDAVRQSIDEIKSDNSLTAEEFANRMVYVEPYGYLTKFHWGFLAAAYMAKLTSWKYVLLDFYFDFQRVPSNSEAFRDFLPNEVVYVPDLDKLFLHNFDMTEEDFLKDLFNLVKSGAITFEDIFPDGSLPATLNDNLTSTHLVESDYKIELFPNPVTDMIYLKSSYPLTKLELYNSMGQIQQIQKFNDHRLNVASLPKGLYYLKIFQKDTHFIITKKFVKE